jgi:hypothetical protein
MTAEKKRASGHVSFRLPPERHEDLLAVTRAFGIDLTGLLNQMVFESLPAYMAKASRLSEEAARLRTGLDAALFRLDHPLVQEALEAGRHAAFGGRMQAVAAFAAGKRDQLGGAPVERWAGWVLEHLQREDLEREVAAAVSRIEAGASEEPIRKIIRKKQTPIETVSHAEAGERR